MGSAVCFPEVPYVDTVQMIEIDRAMMVDYGIELIQMMENAGRHLAHLSRQRFLDGDPVGKKIDVMAGGGGNGGGVLVAARHLHNWGARVRVLLGQPADKMRPVPARQLAILRRLRVPGTAAPTRPAAKRAHCDLILDGLIGYSLRGAPFGVIAALIRWANASETPILALDTPSGVDTTTGTVFDPAIKAAATMALALPKAGLRAPGVIDQVGELYLADIGVPPELYVEPLLSLKVGPLFAREDIIRLR